MKKLLAVLAFLLAGSALAQQAPEGNAHPQAEAVAPVGAGAVNPFGEPEIPSPTKPDAKQKLAASVDLTPLRGLAVYHNRVKVLDTLARESVRAITGRKDYNEAAAGEGAEGVVSYDPLFSLLDLMIDPWYYADKPLIGVDFLPLRRKVLEAEFPGDAAQQERWLKSGRLSQLMLMRHGPAIQQEQINLPYDTAFRKVAEALRLASDGWRNLDMVAPDSPEKPYLHLSSLPADHPARVAAMEMGRAWRAGDATGVNAAVRAFAAALPQPAEGAFSRELEIKYNEYKPFEWGYWVYLAAFVTLVIAFGTERRGLVGLGVGLLLGAVGLHAFGFVTRCIIAQRFAIQNQFESMTGVSLFANIVGITIMLVGRQWLFGAAAAGVGFMVLLTATQQGIPGAKIDHEAAILNTSVLLKYHVTTVLSSYGLISLGFIISLFYLATHYAARFRAAGSAPVAAAALNLPEGEPRGPARTLSDLDKAQMVVLQLAFWTLGVGLLLGAWWADHSWGRWWAFDPKETWALATWIIYLIVVHVRVATGPRRGLTTAWLSVLGFVMMLWTYFGVNLLLPGLHAYA